MSKRLYVGNLSYNTTEEDLREHFLQSGSVDEVKIMMDRDTGRPRGFAFVEMSSDQEARDAISQLNGRELDGRSLKINEAQERSGGGGGGGGGGGFRSGGGGGGGGFRSGGGGGGGGGGGRGRW
ncbi:MAG: RNA-binding protein [Polyangia bacterium]